LFPFLVRFFFKLPCFILLGAWHRVVLPIPHPLPLLLQPLTASTTLLLLLLLLSSSSSSLSFSHCA
jgi:hypothetical protein